MNVTILGAGAIGSLWAHHLKKAGHNVSLWQSNPEQSEIVLKLDDCPPCRFITNSALALVKTDLLLVTVKSWQVKEALSPLLQYLAPETIILLMHNGMGSVSELPEMVNRHPMLLGTTAQAAYKPSAGHTLHKGTGVTRIGAHNALGKQCEFLSDVLEHALAPVEWRNDIDLALWQKLVINCAINPLTAIHQCRNGELLDNRFQQQLAEITNEISVLLQAEGYTVSASELLAQVLQVAEATSENHSSMKQDIELRRKTEIDYISGYVCRVADRHHIAVPENRKLYNKIKQIEASWSAA